MGKIRLTLSCWDYDRTRALQDGRVEVEGVDLTYLPLRVEETFWRMLRYGEFDVAEMSTGSYLMSRDKGAPRLIGIPSAFPNIRLPWRPGRAASCSMNTACCRKKCNGLPAARKPLDVRTRCSISCRPT